MLLLLTKMLESPPRVIEQRPLRTRCYVGEADIPLWLEIRAQALAGQAASGRAWTEKDFRREFLSKSWWCPEWMWFAEQQDEKYRKISVGAVALRRLENAAASIQWLLVAPDHRRRGVGRRLVSILEAAAWDAGCRVVVAETLSTWEGAVRFYERLGYRPAEHRRGTGVS